MAFFNAMLLKSPSTSYAPGTFVSSWKTDNPGTSTSTQITVPTVVSGTYNCIVDWGDGTTSTITTYNDAAWTHTYSIAGTYTVTITGTFTGIQFNGGGDRRKILNILQVGCLKLGNTGGYFNGCSNLTWTATDVLDMTGTTVMSSAFTGCAALTTIPSINSWAFSAVTLTNLMFSGCSVYNQALTWVTTALTNTASMFLNCAAFNSAVTFSDMSHVTTINSTFEGCTIFNQPLTWTTTALTISSNTFRNCLAFNSVLTFSDMSHVTTVSSMFLGCVSYNLPLTWTTTALTSPGSMFSGCTAFNSVLTFSDMSHVTSIANMFLNCTSYNQPLAWTTTALTNTSVAFQGCSAFNSVLTFSDMSHVTTMSSMFNGCTSYNLPLTWTTTALTNTSSMFQNATSFNSVLTFSDMSHVTTVASMFLNASAFDQDISGWVIAGLTGTGGSNFLTNSAFSITNLNKVYDSVTGWPSQATIKSNVTISFGSAHYSGTNAIAGRAVLTGTKTWTITDGGTP